MHGRNNEKVLQMANFNSFWWTHWELIYLGRKILEVPQKQNHYHLGTFKRTSIRCSREPFSHLGLSLCQKLYCLWRWIRYIRGDPKNTRIYLLKNHAFILACLNFSHIQGTLHLMQCTYWDTFPLFKSFWAHWFWCLLVFLPFFCLTSSTSVKHFPLRTFFIQGKKKKLLGPRLGLLRGWDTGVMPFLVKKCWTQNDVGRYTGETRCTGNHPSWNGQTHWVFKKNSVKPNAASHNNSRWYTDTYGFLEHSPSGRHLYHKGLALWNIILDLFLVPSSNLCSHRADNPIE